MGHARVPDTKRAQLDERRNVGGGSVGPTSICNNAGSPYTLCQGNQRKTSYTPSSPSPMGRHKRKPTRATKNLTYRSHSAQIQGFQIDLRPLLPFTTEKWRGIGGGQRHNCQERTKGGNRSNRGMSCVYCPCVCRSEQGRKNIYG
jgi:hypothetical protein